MLLKTTYFDIKGITDIKCITGAASSSQRIFSFTLKRSSFQEVLCELKWNFIQNDRFFFLNREVPTEHRYGTIAGERVNTIFKAKIEIVNQGVKHITCTEFFGLIYVKLRYYHLNKCDD